MHQANNDDKHHHPLEKTVQVETILKGQQELSILETNAGWGNLTLVYNNYGNVYSQDIDQKKIDYINTFNKSNITPIKCDSFKQIHKDIYNSNTYDVVDLDPYGFPSRYFPHVFKIIRNGWLFVTFPKMGVQQINKLMVEHYRIFWDISLDDKEVYQEKIINKIKDYGLVYGRRVEILDCLDLGKVLRLAFQIKEESMLDLVGLKVKGVNC